MHRPPPYPLDEQHRLEALRRYRIVDTDPEPQFDRIVDMAKRRFGVPIALVAFMDADRNFFKARCNLPMLDAPRDISFCGYTILDDGVLVVGDATTDERFAENPFVVGDFHLRFYAGAPLIASSGHRIGTVCLLDTKPNHSFSEEDARDLQNLASIVSDHLEMRLIVGDVHDEIKARRAAEAEAQQLAYQDVLTGLPNRAQLQKVIKEGLPFALQGTLAALAADLDDFKGINQTLGHRAGDQLLQKTADMIKATLGDRAFVARISSDEFVALLDGESRQAVQAVTEEIVTKTSAPIVLAGRAVSTSVSIGVAFADTDAQDIKTLLKNADLALREAKRSGRGRISIFDENIASAMRRRSRLTLDLASAVKEQAIGAFFQPIHHAPDGRMIGLEALARWTHPELGPISPTEFIPLAEESGQILELGERILRTSLQAASAWGNIFVSVNLSPLQFKVTDLASTVASILNDARFPAARLLLEVTESVLLHDLDSAKRRIEELHGIGVRVALDDFGTGYSSLNYLPDLPFDKIKLDRSLVTGARHDDRRHAVIRHIIALARDLDMGVTAEGVETEEEAILLTAAGCTSLQGYYFGRPMPACEIIKRMNLSRAVA